MPSWFTLDEVKRMQETFSHLVRPAGYDGFLRQYGV
jgi:hypothetical protein